MKKKHEKAKRFGDVELDIYPLASTTRNDVISFSATDSMLFIDKTKKRSESAMTHRSNTSAKRIRSVDNIRPLTRNRLREIEIEEMNVLERRKEEIYQSFTQFGPEDAHVPVQRPHTSVDIKRTSVSPMRYVSNLSENSSNLRTRPSISPQRTSTSLLTFVPSSNNESHSFNRSLPLFGGNSSEAKDLVSQLNQKRIP